MRRSSSPLASPATVTTSRSLMAHTWGTPRGDRTSSAWAPAKAPAATVKGCGSSRKPSPEASGSAQQVERLAGVQRRVVPVDRVVTTMRSKPRR